MGPADGETCTVPGDAGGSVAVDPDEGEERVSERRPDGSVSGPEGIWVAWRVDSTAAQAGHL